MLEIALDAPSLDKALGISLFRACDLRLEYVCSHGQFLEVIS